MLARSSPSNASTSAGAHAFERANRALELTIGRQPLPGSLPSQLNELALRAFLLLSHGYTGLKATQGEIRIRGFGRGGHAHRSCGELSRLHARLRRCTRLIHARLYLCKIEVLRKRPLDHLIEHG
jgi:hypothetical protein